MVQEKTKVSVKEFKDYLKTRKPHSQQDVEIFYKDFVTKYMMDYEKSMLYTNYPEYKALMQEFKDGILLFEISDQKVWKNRVKILLDLNNSLKPIKAIILGTKGMTLKYLPLVKRGDLQSDLSSQRLWKICSRHFNYCQSRIST